MDVQTMPLGRLRPDPRNARKHNERNLAEIGESLSRYGQQLPLVVGSAVEGGRYTVRVGSGRLEAMRRLGWAEAAVVVSDLPPAELRAYAVADNHTATTSEWDADELAALCEGPDGLDLTEVGFASDEIDALLAAAQPPPTVDAVQRKMRAAKGTPIKLTADQRAAMDEVFDRFRQVHGDGPAMTEGQMVLLIAADWFAGA